MISMISALICTYGEDEWRQLANQRAVPSAERQDAQIIAWHQATGTIAESRNHAAGLATQDWLCFLDADDELAPGYIQAMTRAAAKADPRTLLTPAVSYVRNGHRKPPQFWPPVPLERANWLVIGTLIHRDLFWEVGGFKDYGDPPGSNAIEDWGLWTRCHKAGASVVKVPRAIYIAHVDVASRHRGVTPATMESWRQEIGRDVWPELYGAAV